MAQPASTFVDESRERINAARDRVDSEIRRAQKQLNQRRKRIEAQLQRNRKTFEKRARKQVGQLRKEFEKNGLVKQLNRLRSDAEEQFENVMETLLGTVGIATRSDVSKIDRKLSKINKKLKEMDGAKRRSQAAPPHTAGPRAPHPPSNS